MKKGAGIAKKSVIDYFAQNAALAVTFVAGILATRFLGKEGYGIYSLVLLANMLLVLFANMGVEISTRVFAGKDEKKAAQVHTAGVLLILAVSVFGAVILFFTHDLIRATYFRGVPPRFLLLAALLAPFSLYQLVWQGVMVGLGEIATYARFFMWNRIAQGGAIIILIAFFYPSLELLIYVWIVIQLVTIIFCILVMAGRHRLFSPVSLSLVNRILGFGWIVYLGNLAATLINKYSFLIISSLSGPGEVGLYNRAATFSDKITLISGSLERATYQPAAKADRDFAPHLIQKVFRYNLYVNILGAAAMYIFGSLCIRLLLQEEFLASLFPLKFLLVSVIFMSCSRILAVYFTAHLGKPSIPGIINWIILPVSLTLYYVLTKTWGIRGASVATAAVYFLHACLFFIFFLIRNRSLKIGDFFLFHSDDLENIKKILFKNRAPE